MADFLYEVEDDDGIYQFNSDIELDEPAVMGAYQDRVIRPKKREAIIQSAAGLEMGRDQAALNAAAKQDSFTVSGTASALTAAVGNRLDPEGVRRRLDSYAKNEWTREIDPTQWARQVVMDVSGTPTMPVGEAIAQSDQIIDNRIRKSVLELDPEDRQQALADIKTLSDVNRGRKDAAVVNGSLRLNPDLIWSLDKANAAVMNSEASDDQKATLIDQLPQLRTQAGQAQLPVFEQLSEFKDFAKENPDLKNPADLIQAYKDENTGWFDQMIPQAKLGLSQGRAQIAQQLQGLAGAVIRKIPGAQEVGSQLVDAALISGEESQKLGGMANIVGGAPIIADLVSGATSMAPALAGGWLAGAAVRAISMAGKGAAVGAELAAAESVAAKAASDAGFAGSVGASGLQSFAATYPEAIQAFEKTNLAQGMTPEEASAKARDQAYLPAMLNGLSTAAVTALGGKVGVESVFALKDEALKSTFKGFAKDVFKDIGAEALEEGSDQFIQGLVTLHTYDPDKPINEVVEEAFKAAVIGGALGGVVGGGKQALEAVAKRWETEKVEPAAAEAEAAGSPETADALRAQAEAAVEEKFAAAEASIAEAQPPAAPEVTAAEEPVVKDYLTTPEPAAEESPATQGASAPATDPLTPATSEETPAVSAPPSPEIPISPELVALAPETAAAVQAVNAQQSAEPKTPQAQSEQLSEAPAEPASPPSAPVVNTGESPTLTPETQRQPAPVPPGESATAEVAQTQTRPESLPELTGTKQQKADQLDALVRQNPQDPAYIESLRQKYGSEFGIADVALDSAIEDDLMTGPDLQGKTLVGGIASLPITDAQSGAVIRKGAITGVNAAGERVAPAVSETPSPAATAAPNNDAEAPLRDRLREVGSQGEAQAAQALISMAPEERNALAEMSGVTPRNGKLSAKQISQVAKFSAQLSENTGWKTAPAEQATAATPNEAPAPETQSAAQAVSESAQTAQSVQTPATESQVTPAVAPVMSEAALKRREAQQRRLNTKLAETGSFSKYDSRIDKELASQKKPLPAPDPKKVARFGQFLDAVTSNLQGQFTPEITDAVKSTALRYYTHELQKGNNPRENTILQDVRQDYAEKVSTRPELQRQASLDAPVGDSGTALGDLQAAETEDDTVQEYAPILASTLQKLRPADRRKWTSVFQKMGDAVEQGIDPETAVKSLTPEEQDIYRQVQSIATKSRAQDLSAAGGRAMPAIDKSMIRSLQSGQYVTERVPTEIRSGSDQRDLLAAEAVARRSHGAVRPGTSPLQEFAGTVDPTERWQKQYEVAEAVKPAEEAALRQWATANDKLVPAKEFTDKWEAQGERGGAEHQVYYDEDSGKWVKRNNLLQNLDNGHLGYLQRIMLHNHYFPEAPLTFEGFTEVDGELQPVVSQPNVQGEDASIPEIQAYMESMDWQRTEGTNTYVSPDGQVEVADLHEGNVLRLPSGKFAVIDPVIKMTESTKLDRLTDMALNGETQEDNLFAAMRDVAQQKQGTQAPVSDNPLVQELQDELETVAPGTELIVARHPNGSPMWTDGKSVFVDPERLQAKLDEHPESPGLKDRMINEEVKHIAALSVLSREEAVSIGVNLSSSVAAKVASTYVVRQEYDTDESYEAAVNEFQADKFQLAHEYLRMVGQRFESGMSTEDLQIPQDPGIIATIRKYLQAALRFLQARLEVAFNSDLATHISRIKTAERALGMRESAIAELGLTPEETAALSTSGGDQTQTPRFQAWFGQSKVTNPNGSPMMVYTGSPRELGDVFKPNRHPGLVKAGRNDFGFFFTPQEFVARMYAGQGPVKAVYLSLQNPLDLTEIGAKVTPESLRSALEQAGVDTQALTMTPSTRRGAASVWAFFDTQSDAFKSAIQQAGYDGVVFEDDSAVGKSWVAFESGQIKSATNNRGTFDPENPNILFAAGNRQTSTALYRVLSDDLDPDTKKLIAEKEYISETWNNAEKQANDWIAKQGDPRSVADLDAIAQKVDGSYLADEYKLYAKSSLALRYGRLMDAIKAGAVTLDQAIVYDHIKRQHQRLITQISEGASRGGQMLAMIKGISKLFVPDTYVASYRGKLTKDHGATIAGTEGEAAVGEALDKGRTAGAAAATTRGLKALKKMLPGGDPAQDLFDFFADALSLRERGTIQGTGLPPLEELKQDVAKRVSKMLLAQGGVKPTDSLFADLNKRVTAAVNAQLKEPVYGPAEAPPTDAEKRTDLLNSLVEQISNLDLVEQAFNQSVQDTLAGTPRPMTARIARLEGMKFDRQQYTDATKFVTTAVNFKDLVTQTLEAQDSELFNLLASVSTATGLQGEQARLLAEAIQSGYDLAARTEARKQLDAIANAWYKRQEDKGKIKLTESQITKLLKMVNLGAFQQEKFYNAIAESFGLPTYDDKFADSVEERGRAIQKMPESDAKNEAVRRLLSDIAHERVKGYDWKQKAKFYLGDVAPAIWQAGVLSGVPTHLVNYFSSQTNVLLSAAADAAGYVQAARKAGIKGANTGSFMSDVLVGWLKGTGLMKTGTGSATAQEIQKALTTGTTRFWNERGEEMSVLENFPWFLPYKFVGRLMVATDVVNQISANEIKQRMCLRYMWLQEGKTAKEIQKLMSDAFDPSGAVLDQIDAQVASEKEYLPKSLDQARRRTELIEKRRFELLDGLDQQSRAAANVWTFNSDTPTGMMGYIANEIITPFNQKTKVGKFIFPFVRTLAGIVNNTFDWSPIGIARGYNITATKILGLDNYVRDFKPQSPEQYAQLTKAWLGTMAFMAIGAAMAKGWEDEDKGEEPAFAIYGEGPDDPMERRQLEEGSSWQANTVKIGSLRLRYTDFPILSLLLGSLGKASDMHRSGKYSDKDWPEIAVKSGLSIGSSLLEKNLLSGASNLMDIMSDPEGRGVGALKRFTSGIVGGYTNPQLFKWSRSTLGMDSKGMVPSLDQSTMEGWLMSMVPFSAGYNEPYLNVLGEPIVNFPWAATTRRFGVMDPTPQHPILTPLVNAGLFIPSPSKNTTIGKGENKLRVGSDPELWRDFVRARGAELKKRLTPEKIQALLAMDKEKAQSELDEVIAARARDAAKSTLTKARK